MPSFSRRQLLQAAGLAGVAGAVGWPDRVIGASVANSRGLVQQAASVSPAGSDLGAIDHVIYLMMENRSYDHYFGSYQRGRGFDDHPPGDLSTFAQAYPGGSGLSPANVLLPFHLDIDNGDYTQVDLGHGWATQHSCWNLGTMDAWVKTHTSAGNEGAAGVGTMGYFTRSDLPFYYALADAFTLCDNYHCSVLGPTHPNRIMAQSGTINPSGGLGGPITETSGSPDLAWTCGWPTIQEVLEDAGISWKQYNPSNLDLIPKYAFLEASPMWNPALYSPENPISFSLVDYVQWYFRAFRKPSSALYQKAFLPTFPGEFHRDVMRGTLPQVSWLAPPEGWDEHPSGSPVRGMFYTQMVLDILASNPDVWSRTALLLMYDENDGFFDHVVPPFSWPGTPGEYISAGNGVGESVGDRGPIGLGVRVPCLVISPFSRGGHIASEVFDHTSQLKFLGTRFGVEVPGISDFRNATVGDLTSSLFQAPADYDMPPLPAVTVAPIATSLGGGNEFDQDTDSGGNTPVPPVHQVMPTQETPLS
jgi:phospholipase C